MKMAVKLTIDGKPVEVQEGLTILEAARQNGIQIPTLCYLKELDPRASLCARGLPVSGDDSLHSVIRDPNKCIKCRRCVDVCNEVQTVHNLAMFGRGQEYRVTAAMDRPMKESPCVRCGRCVDVCPTGSVYMEESINKMLYYAHSYDTFTCGMVSSSVLPELERLLKMEPGTLDIHRVIAGMKKVGISCVISEDEAVNACKEAGEKLIREAEGPVVISSSYAVKNFAQACFPELAERIRFYPSVQESFAAIAEAFCLENAEAGKERKTCVFTAGNENGAQAKETGRVDFSMNAREIYRLFLRSGVNLRVMEPEDALKFRLDPSFAFGTVTGPLAFSYAKDPEILRIDGKTIAVARNLGQTRRLLTELASGNCHFDVIRLGA